MRWHSLCQVTFLQLVSVMTAVDCCSWFPHFLLLVFFLFFFFQHYTYCQSCYLELYILSLPLSPSSYAPRISLFLFSLSFPKHLFSFAPRLCKLSGYGEQICNYHAKHSQLLLLLPWLRCLLSSVFRTKRFICVLCPHVPA